MATIFAESTKYFHKSLRAPLSARRELARIKKHPKLMGASGTFKRPVVRPHKEWWCSFCNKHQGEARLLVAAPENYALPSCICDACVRVCVEIMNEQIAKEAVK